MMVDTNHHTLTCTLEEYTNLQYTAQTKMVSNLANNKGSHHVPAKGETNVLPSPVFISAMAPSCNTAPPRTYNLKHELCDKRKYNHSATDMKRSGANTYLHIEVSHSQSASRSFSNNSERLCTALERISTGWGGLRDSVKSSMHKVESTRTSFNII